MGGQHGERLALDGRQAIAEQSHRPTAVDLRTIGKRDGEGHGQQFAVVLGFGDGCQRCVDRRFVIYPGCDGERQARCAGIGGRPITLTKPFERLHVSGERRLSNCVCYAVRRQRDIRVIRRGKNITELSIGETADARVKNRLR